MQLKIVCSLSFLLLAACSSQFKDVPYGVGALPVGPPEATSPQLESYRIGVLDELSINVFNEPNLSVENIVVDAAGNLNLPLIGSLPAVNRTVNELSEEIARLLNQRYLRNARVAVSVSNAVGYTFTVDGRVKKPGTYKIPGRVSLAQAIAISEGVADNAELSEVIILRTIQGEQYAARFNLNAIRAAKAENPELRPGDIVVVGFDRASAILRDSLPLLSTLGSLFVLISQNN